MFQGRQFSRRQFMGRTSGLLLALLAFAAPDARAQQAERGGMPDSVLAHMERTVGLWVTDNSAYQGDDDPYDAYVLEWSWGAGNRSLVGRLYALVGDDDSGTFWDFRQFWHPGEEAVIVQQFGGNGTFGTGPVTWPRPGTTELIQTFYAPDGSSTRHRHVTRETATEHDGASFNWVDGEWKADRRYVWRRRE